MASPVRNPMGITAVNNVPIAANLVSFAETELFKAIEAKDEKLALSLIQSGVSLDVIDEVKAKGRTYLIWAAEQGLTSVCEELIKRGLKVDATCQFSPVPTVTLNLNALVGALYSGNLNTAQFLISQGADVNFKVGGKPLLHMYIEKPKIVEFLLSNRADPEATDEVHKYTALHFAAGSGCLETCEILLKRTINKEALDLVGSTPLFSAIRSKNKHVVELLLKAKCNPFHVVIFRRQFNALHWAASLGFLDGCRILLDAGLGINSLDGEKNTPLHFAARSCDESLISFLLSKNADSRAVCKNGFTPLYHLKSVLFPWPSDRFKDLVQKDGGLTDSLIELRMLGHKFTLNGDYFEGTSIDLAFHTMAESLENYRQSGQSDPIIEELPGVLREASQNANNPDYFIKRIKEKKLTILPSHWLGHGTLVIIWDCLICTFNRGENSGPNKGLKICRIGNTSKIPIVVNKLMRVDSIQKSDVDYALTSDKILDKIKEDKVRAFEDIDTDLELEVLDIIPYKNSTAIGQQGQNCVWLAAKVGYKGSLYLREYHQNIANDKITVRQKVKRSYSPWLTFDFTRGLEQLQTLRQMPHTSRLVNYDEIYAALFKKLFKFKRAQALSELFRQCPRFLNDLDYIGNSLLQRKEVEGSLEFTEFLIKEGVDVNHTNSLGRTRLNQEMAKSDRSYAMLELLCAFNADFDLVKEGDFSNIELAIFDGDERAVRLLLDKGARIDRVNGQFTTMSIAEEINNESILAILKGHAAKQASTNKPKADA